MTNNIEPYQNRHITLLSLSRIILSSLSKGIVNVLFCSMITVAASGISTGQSVWELQPYNIDVLLAFEPSLPLTTALESDLIAGLTDRVDTFVGAPWQFTAKSARPALSAAILRSIEDVATEDLPSDSLAMDKVFLIAISREMQQYFIQVRELDVTTRLWGITVMRPIPQLEKLGDVIMSAIFETFSPLARIASVDKDQVVLHPKAGRLQPRDPALQWIHQGDILRPVVRYNNKDGTPRRIIPIAWTFLYVENISKDNIQSRLFTGMRSPLSGRRRGRVQAYALRVATPRQSSTLTLVSRTDPKQALGGYDVYSHPPTSKKTVHVGSSNWQGQIIIPTNNHVLRILLITSGNNVLARLPIVPGLESSYTATLPNDNQRLAVEGIITGVQEDLVDLVTRRQVLLARAATKIEGKQYKQARLMIDQLRRLPTSLELTRELKAQKKKFLSKDKTIQTKINALFADTQKLIEKHLDPQDIERLWQQLRKASADAKPSHSKEITEDIPTTAND